MRCVYCCCILFLLSLFLRPPLAQAQRSFDDIFPGISPDVRKGAFSSEGFSRSFKETPASALIGSGQSAINPQIIESVFIKQPAFLVESILVIPDHANKYTLLDVYNATGKVRGLKGRLYPSYSRGEYIPLFEEVTRIESSKKNVPVDDPSPALRIPPYEIIYMRLKDANFGTTFYRSEMRLEQRGMRYSLCNNKTVNYYFLPVIKEEKFIAQFYFELIREGILIYSISGADVSDFVSSRINMPSAISKRLAVLIDWVVDGITG